MSTWYRKVQSDLTQLPSCIIFFEKELDDARNHLGLKGKSLERHAADLAGIVEHRFGQLQEIEAILEFLNLNLKKVKSAKFKYYLEGYAKALTSRDCEKYAEGHPDVVSAALLVNEFAMVRNKYLALSKGFETKNWMIGHIVRLRVAGLDDAKVD